MQYLQEAADCFESPNHSSAHSRPFHLFMDYFADESDSDESQWMDPSDDDESDSAGSQLYPSGDDESDSAVSQLYPSDDDESDSDESQLMDPSDDDEDLQKGSTDLHTDNCPYCSCLVSAEHKYRSMAKVQGLVFHEECQSCSSPDRARIRLCDFCKHLRLGHLVECIRRDSRFRDLSINLDPKARARSRKECDLCGFLTDAISLPQTGPSENKIIVATSAYLKCERSVQYISGDRGIPASRFCSTLNVDRQGSRAMHLNFYCYANRLLVATDTSLHFRQFVQWDVVRDWLLKDDFVDSETILRLLASSDSDEDDTPSREISPKPTLPPGFRVIDVNKRCVIEREGACEYMALSYVWGTRSESARYVEQATCDNFESLKVPGGLTRLPETIEDAIAICRELGIDYLWVDRYCIVQDHVVHKHTQVSAMANIYSSAILTVIACSGKDGVESGIPGVRRKREWKWRCINIRDLAFSYSLPSLQDIFSTSIWNTRGWTYQEAILSKRKLIMTPTEAWFQYGNKTLREHLPCYGDQNAAQLRDWKRPRDSWKHYVENVKRYTRRELGYASDIYNAFDGIAHALSEGKYDFHFGLPESEFDQALLWYCGCRWNDARSGCLRSCAETTPSWSWGSVTCEVWYPKSFYVTLVKWVLYETQDADMGSQSTNPETYGARGKELKAVDEPRSWRETVSDWRRENSCPQLAFALAVNEGCIGTEKDFIIPEQESFLALSAHFMRRWPNYADAYKEVRQVHARHSSGPHGALFTNAQSAFFHIKSNWIKNARGKTIGSLRQKGIGDEYSDFSSNDEYEECSAHQECSTDEECYVEGIALSVSSFPGYPLDAVREYITDVTWNLKEADPIIRYRDCDDDGLSDVLVVNVMFICREDGYAERIGLGWIFLKQWGSVEWTLKDIWLK